MSSSKGFLWSRRGSDDPCQGNRSGMVVGCPWARRQAPFARRVRSGLTDARGTPAAVLSPPPQARRIPALEPVADEGADHKGRHGQQPEIPTCPERRVVHDHSSCISAIEESKHHTVVHFTGIDVAGSQTSGLSQKKRAGGVICHVANRAGQILPSQKPHIA